jgi:hypothetical protein
MMKSQPDLRQLGSTIMDGMERIVNKRQETSIRRRWPRVLSLRTISMGVLGLLVLLGAASLFVAIGWFYLFGAVGSRVVSTMGTSAPTFAFQGLVFRAGRARADATGWRPVAVAVGETGTIVIGVGPSASQPASGSGQPAVLLFDSAGHSIAQSSLDLGDTGYRPTGPSQIYNNFDFAPLPAGTSLVRIKHNVPGAARPSSQSTWPGSSASRHR